MRELFSLERYFGVDAEVKIAFAHSLARMQSQTQPRHAGFWAVQTSLYISWLMLELPIAFALLE